MGKIKKNINEQEKRSFLVAQDLKLVRALAGNDKKVRDKVLKNLKKWFEHRTASKIAFTKEDFIRLWKGLFYTMWMSDKPLVQEECAEKIAKLIHFADGETSLLFFECALIVMATEWFGIDQLRLDKFLMFVRRILRQAFEVLKRNDWESDLVTEFSNILLKTILKTDSNTHLGLTMHITEIYLEELAKVSKGEIEKHLTAELIKPFVKQLSGLGDDRQIVHLQKHIFHHLLHQSDEGVEYNVKFEAWKQRGFPGGTIDSMQKIEASDEDISDLDDEEEHEEENEMEEKPLDPRAGHVDVDLPQLEFDGHEISQLLLENKFAKGSTARTRKVITKLAQDFEKLSKGDFPLGIKEIRLPEYDGHSTKLKKSVNRLIKFEKKLLADSNKNLKRKMKNKKIESLKNPKTDTEDQKKLPEDSNKTRKRKMKNKNTENLKKPKTDTEELSGLAELFQDKFQKFIEKSEGNLTNGHSAIKKKKLSLKSTKVPKRKTVNKHLKCIDDGDFESRFRRNSGTWTVHRLDNMDDSQISEKSDSLVSTEDVSVEQNGDNTVFKKPLESPKLELLIKNDNNKTTPKLRKKRNVNIFPQSEWDLPLKEGEVEICVPSNKFKKKMEKVAQKTGKNLSDLLNNSMNNMIKTRHSLNNSPGFASNKIKTRFSLDANLVKNPFSTNGATPKGEKKVKIDLKLNQSQEIHEHEQQLKSSPAIPYDANKRPSKPLLKPNAIGSPINPFYKKKAKLLL